MNLWIKEQALPFICRYNNTIKMICQQFFHKKITKEEIDDTKWSRIYNVYKILDPEIKLTIKEDGYEFKVKLNTSIEGCDIKAELKYSFEADEVNISKPEETGAKEIISYFKDNKDGFEEKLNSIKGALTAYPTVSDILDVMQKEFGGPAIQSTCPLTANPNFLMHGNNISEQIL